MAIADVVRAERHGSRWETRSLLGFDLETTGVDRFSDRPVAAAFVEAAGTVVVRRQYRLIDPGVEVPDGACAVHGISTQMSRQGIALEEACEKFLSIFSGAARRKDVVVGMNLSYDLTMVDALCRGLLCQSIATLGLLVADVLVIDRHFEPYRPGKRRLEDLCAHYGVELHNAHDALGDVEGSLGVLAKQLAIYPELADLDPAALTVREVAWHDEWATGYSSWRCRNGQGPLSPEDHLWPIALRDRA